MIGRWQVRATPAIWKINLVADVKSVFRILQVLEFFANHQRPARVIDIYGSLGVPQSSTSKILISLTRRGYLDYDAVTRTYFPTLRVAMLGNWLHERWFESRSLMAIAEDLRGSFGTSVILGAQNDTKVMYILALPALVRPRPPLGIGALRPLCQTGVGKALMMLKTDAEASLLIRRINAEGDDPDQHVPAKAFIEELQTSRERGYAVTHGDLVPGTGVVAIPLHLVAHQPQMALGLGTTLDVLDDQLEVMVAALKDKRELLASSALLSN